MSTAWRWLSRLLMVLLVFAALLAAIWTYGRLTSPTPAQHAAIALMQQEEAVDPSAENGFPLMMALPPAPGLLPAGVNCGNTADEACIAAIEAAPEASAAAIEPFRPHLEAAARALHAPVFRDPRASSSMGIDDIPPFQAVVQLDSLRALDFAAGNTVGALSAACEDADGAARWAARPDTLIQGMVAIAAFRQHSAFIADMRRRAPADALPPSCVALAEPPDAAAEGLLCPALRGEFRYQQRTLPSLEASMTTHGENPWAARLTPLMHDTGWMLAQTARAFSAACGESAKQAARDDRAVALAPAKPRWVDYVAFPTSVLLADIAAPAYTDYAERQLDFVAQRRLLAAFLQMDAMDAALTPVQRFEALPETLRGGPRPLRFDASTGRLSVPLRGRTSGEDGGEAAFLVATPPPAP
jgi:hypothetical protein